MNACTEPKRFAKTMWISKSSFLVFLKFPILLSLWALHTLTTGNVKFMWTFVLQVFAWKFLRTLRKRLFRLAGGVKNLWCGTIKESKEERFDNLPIPQPWLRASTISTSPTKLPRPTSLSTSDRGGGRTISPQFLFLQLYQAAGYPHQTH